ncbi:MAG: tyrosine-type recombinase/integrase [Syntrophales bacterium]|nr:tyrosine-type recombinase/integrase [Syntrophales bacterium]
MKRIKTGYPGVFYREAVRIGGKGKERVFYIVFKKDGKVLEEKAGRQYADDMTAAKAARIRADRIEGRRSSRKETREKAKAAGEAPTMTRLWNEYEKQKPDTKAIKTDKGRFEKHIKPTLGDKQPHEIIRLDVDRLRVNLSKKLKPQTVRHVLGLLKRIVRFGANRQLCRELPFPIDTVKVDNRTTEDLTPGQLKKLLKAIAESTDIEAANIMRMALFTGMRRGELFKLKWSDVDFDRGFITIRHDPKGGVSQKIPLNDQARDVLKHHPETADHVFVRGDGKPFTDIRRRVNPIKQAAGIGAGFRALHGLRHVYASMLASSGQVDMYTLQKLLTHKSPIMTQRYAHLRDETLRDASALAGNIIEQAAEKNEEKQAGNA